MQWGLIMNSCIGFYIRNKCLADNVESP
uniref:Uncharacterized protein n=1 Tax=Rhizophora mucronata TaxID=61149 RepID=A0A2P2QD85_RHIMU